MNIYGLFGSLLTKMWLCSGQLVDHCQNATTPCIVWAQIWASSALFIYMAFILPNYGLLVAQICQKGMDRPSGIILHSTF